MTSFSEVLRTESVSFDLFGLWKTKLVFPYQFTGTLILKIFLKFLKKFQKFQKKFQKFQKIILFILNFCLGGMAQGTLLGILNASGSAARLIGPLWSTGTMEKSGSLIVFAVSASALLFSGLLFMIIFRKVKYLVHKNNQVADTMPLL